MGHATRCVPIIRELVRHNTVILGVSPKTDFLLNAYFPELQKVEVLSYGITYSEKVPLWLKLLLQWPRIHTVIRREKKALEHIIAQYRVNVVISDNRFGLVNPSLKCIFITHQLNIKAPVFAAAANCLNRSYIHRFNEVWVPDYENPDLRLSGELSDASRIRIPVRYIGPKSALAENPPVAPAQPLYDYLILLSGPEPQRSRLEETLLNALQTSGKKIVLVRGTNSRLKTPAPAITILDFASGNELRDLIVNAETVICRSGYSTLMDLHLLHRGKYILIPTPGQTEQEYLAVYWKKKFGALNLTQRHIAEFVF